MTSLDEASPSVWIRAAIRRSAAAIGTLLIEAWRA
jgi:hypothetical protein